MLTRMSMLLTTEVHSNQIGKKVNVWSTYKISILTKLTTHYYSDIQYQYSGLINLTNVHFNWQDNLSRTKCEMIANQRKRGRRQPWRLNRWDFVLLSPLVISQPLHWDDVTLLKTGYFSPWIDLCRRKSSLFMNLPKGVKTGWAISFLLQLVMIFFCCRWDTKKDIYMSVRLYGKANLGRSKRPTNNTNQ